MVFPRYQLLIYCRGCLKDPKENLSGLSILTVCRKGSLTLKALGIKIAMDDFGTGYSSLSTLQAFPFDKIKIDRSFIENLDKHHQSASIVRAILALGRSLNVPVLAEGLETQAHLDFLRQEGCDEAQGYLLGRPKREENMFAAKSVLATTATPSFGQGVYS